MEKLALPTVVSWLQGTEQGCYCCSEQITRLTEKKRERELKITSSFAILLYSDIHFTPASNQSFFFQSLVKVLSHLFIPYASPPTPMQMCRSTVVENHWIRLIILLQLQTSHLLCLLVKQGQDEDER